MYWVAFGITNNPIPQNNWLEAFIWTCEFLGLGLVFVAFVFGTIIDRIGQLREERSALQGGSLLLVTFVNVCERDTYNWTVGFRATTTTAVLVVCRAVYCVLCTVYCVLCTVYSCWLRVSRQTARTKSWRYATT